MQIAILYYPITFLAGFSLRKRNEIARGKAICGFQIAEGVVCAQNHIFYALEASAQKSPPPGEGRSRGGEGTFLGGRTS